MQDACSSSAAEARRLLRLEIAAREAGQRIAIGDLGAIAKAATPAVP